MFDKFCFDSIDFSPSKSYLGLKTTGLFAPLAYFRSDNDWGVGDFDTLLEVFRYASLNKQSIIQLLPLNLSIKDNSPYSIASSFILDPVYIGINSLISSFKKTGYKCNEVEKIIGLKQDDINQWNKSTEATLKETRKFKHKILKKLFEIFQKEKTTLSSEFKDFITNNNEWLDNHILFLILSRIYNSDDFRNWPKDIAKREKTTIDNLLIEYKKDIKFESFIQWVITRQLLNVKNYGLKLENSVELMFDQPFAFGNGDVWNNMNAFHIDEKSLKRKFTQGAPPHRLDIPQHWQFSLLNIENPSSKTLLLDRLRFFLQFCSLLRIDHLLGYYQLYYMSEDIEWDFTLKKLNLWKEIESTYRSNKSSEDKREIIYSLIISALKKRLPSEIKDQLFENGQLRKGSAILAARKSFDESDCNKEECGWYQILSEEHSTNIKYTLLNPQLSKENDYLLKIINSEDDFLKESDSLRVCFFNWGLGEDILSDFMKIAQQQGKKLILENLGLVPPPVSKSVKELGACEFKPLYFGYKHFTGSNNAYWYDKILPKDYITFAIHDTVPLESWWSGNGLWSSKKYYFKGDDEKKAVIDWLIDNGYLESKSNALSNELTDEMQKAILSSIAENDAAIAVYMLPDIFKTGEDGILNIPGSTGWWTKRAPVSIEELLISSSEISKKANMLITHLTNCNFRGDIRKQIANSKKILRTIPDELDKQIRKIGDFFTIDVICKGRSLVEVVLLNGKRFKASLSKIDNYSDLYLYRVEIAVTKNEIGCTQFRIFIDGVAETNYSYLIGVENKSQLNPLSKDYSIKPTSFEKIDRTFFESLLNGQLLSWIKEQRWYLEKIEKIESAELYDFFKLPSDNIICYGNICKIKSKSRTINYYIPILFKEIDGNDENAICSVIVANKKYNLIAAEHTKEYQTLLREIADMESELITDRNSIVKSKFLVRKKVEPTTITNSKNLLKGNGDTSSNILTDLEIENKHFIVKTIKSGDSDIEMEMYRALSKAKFKNMPTPYIVTFISKSDKSEIPLSIMLEKLTLPNELTDEPWKMKAGYNIAFLFTLAVDNFVSNKYKNLDTIIDKSLDQEIRLDLLSGSKLKSLDGYSYRDLLCDIGSVIAKFNISLADNTSQGFYPEIIDIDTIKNNAIYNFTNQIEEHLDFASTRVNKLFKKGYLEKKSELINWIDYTCADTLKVNGIRVHGDMQLDQILFDENFNLKIIDFGGAPNLEVAQKRAKTIGTSDIAGIISAFGYIKFYVLNCVQKMDKADIFNDICYKEDINSNKTIEFANLFERVIRKIVTQSFIKTLENEKSFEIIAPNISKDDMKELIYFSTISRALYEINYEISVRPNEENAVTPLSTIINIINS